MESVSERLCQACVSFHEILPYPLSIMSEYCVIWMSGKDEEKCFQFVENNAIMTAFCRKWTDWRRKTEAAGPKYNREMRTESFFHRCAGCLSALAFLSFGLNAQELRLEPLPYGDFENWLVREIKESAVVGGNMKKVYAVAGNDTIIGNVPYENADSPWGSSNVYARVAGVTKVNNNVYPETHGEGRCALLRTEKMSFRVMGMLKMNVLTAGALYLGRMKEPVESLKSTYAMVDMGVPFKKRPSCLVFDYAAKIGNSGRLQYCPGRKEEFYEGYDKAQVFILLQRRWEEDGHVYAERVATGELLIGESTDWKKGCKLGLEYGQPSDTLRLSSSCRLSNIYYTLNSKGEQVPIEEVAWASPDAEPTHLVVFISSGCLGAYRGEEGNELRIDNIYLGY